MRSIRLWVVATLALTLLAGLSVVAVGQIFEVELPPMPDVPEPE